MLKIGLDRRRLEEFKDVTGFGIEYFITENTEGKVALALWYIMFHESEDFDNYELFLKKRFNDEDDETDPAYTYGFLKGLHMYAELPYPNIDMFMSFDQGLSSFRRFKKELWEYLNQCKRDHSWSEDILADCIYESIVNNITIKLIDGEEEYDNDGKAIIDIQFEIIDICTKENKPTKVVPSVTPLVVEEKSLVFMSWGE